MTSYMTSCSVEIGGFLRSIAAEWVSLLSSVFLHCMQAIWCLWISRSHIQSSWGQGHARSRMLGAVFVACFQSFQNYLFSCPDPLDHCLDQNECHIRNQRLWIDYVWTAMCQGPKVIRGHMRSLTLDDLEGSIFLQGSISGCLGVFSLIFHRFIH